ncbi:Uncharacterised protein [Mycoplasmopsis arginini]|nr:Uncharacterised protein [Chlamydia trachomatis]SGA02632.1 Uncharacterised protein [Chlamydia abortus]SGA15063.1 Uncharacterised protein [Mycoplasmopsis arginini]CRH47337.1 Uncharacterised protein [Chlamydia trachomatis]CRH55401.1 Uncharacterised protein [Chlamydia trachomatis]
MLFKVWSFPLFVLFLFKLRSAKPPATIEIIDVINIPRIYKIPITVFFPLKALTAPKISITRVAILNKNMIVTNHI